MEGHYLFVILIVQRQPDPIRPRELIELHGLNYDY
jgi:hypothetical protein